MKRKHFMLILSALPTGIKALAIKKAVEPQPNIEELQEIMNALFEHHMENSRKAMESLIIKDLQKGNNATQ